MLRAAMSQPRVSIDPQTFFAADAAMYAAMADEHERMRTRADGRRFAYVTVEGLIASGKSTFCAHLIAYLRAKYPHLRVVHVDEPVDMWQNAGAHGDVNALGAFYNDAERYGGDFQNLTLATRSMATRRAFVQARNDNADIVLTERCVRSDTIFGFAQLACGNMDANKFAMYATSAACTVATLPVPIVVHLRANVDTCIARKQTRARTEESGVERRYLECLNGLQNEWLDVMRTITPVHEIDGSAVLDTDAYEANLRSAAEQIVRAAATDNNYRGSDSPTCIYDGVAFTETDGARA